MDRTACRHRGKQSGSSAPVVHAIGEGSEERVEEGVDEQRGNESLIPLSSNPPPSACLPCMVGSCGLSEFQTVSQRRGKMNSSCLFKTMHHRNACTVRDKPLATSFLFNLHHQSLAGCFKNKGYGPGQGPWTQVIHNGEEGARAS